MVLHKCNTKLAICYFCVKYNILVSIPSFAREINRNLQTFPIVVCRPFLNMLSLVRGNRAGLLVTLSCTCSMLNALVFHWQA